MHATLLFAPGTDPRSPHLALPSLAAFLREAGVRTSMRDLDLEGLLYLLTPTRVGDAVDSCRALTASSNDEDRARLRSLLVDADSVVEHIGTAPCQLRDPTAFYDPYAHHAARRHIRSALELISASTGWKVDYGTEPAHYDVRGMDVMRLADLAAVTADPEANLFESYYQSVVLPDLERDRPDLVAVSILNLQQVIPGLTLARRIKERGHFVVVGGTLYTKFVGELLQRPEFFHLFCDGLIAHEGETALLTLLEQLAGKRDFSQVPNFLYLDGDGRVAFTRYHLEDVSSLPTPDFDGLPLADYLAPVPVLPILTGKGCYFNRCKFCDIPYINHISKKAYRVRAPERVAQDVATLHARHGARHFEITDEALAPKLLLRLADALDDFPEVRPRFVGYARLEPGFTPEVCKRVFDMGFRKLFFGLESGSQATLDHMDKGIRVDDARVVLRNCAEAGIGFHVFTIVGFPEETESRARETAQFFVDNAPLIDNPRNSFDIHPFSLDLRTDYAEQATSFGVEIDFGDLGSRDFPLSAVRWHNRHGMDDDTIDRLLREFHGQLRSTYRAYHNYPLTLWPGYEEYAVLYGDCYDQRQFPYRICLPLSGDDRLVRLLWSEQANIQPFEGDYLVSGPFGTVVVGENALALLARPREPLRVDDLFSSLVQPFRGGGRDVQGVTEELPRVIDWLLGTGALQVVCT